jgi:hypothetical protein
LPIVSCTNAAPPRRRALDRSRPWGHIARKWRTHWILHGAWLRIKFARCAPGDAQRSMIGKRCVGFDERQAMIGKR